MKMPSIMNHSFSQVPGQEFERSVFDRSFGHKTMFSSGYLIPFYREEVLPGDTFNVNAAMFVRMPSALQVPVMDNMYLDTHFFFIPLRLIWTNFEKFMGAQANPADSTSYTVPVFTAFNPTAESLHDYLGIPPLGGGATVDPISLYHRSYNLCWNEFFRDENLQNSVTVDKGDGPDTAANYVLLTRGKRKDYFTSALPWTQKGTAVSAGLSGNAPVTGIALPNTGTGGASGTVYETAIGSTSYAASRSAAVPASIKQVDTGGGVYWPSIYANLASATGMDINALRLAFQLQRFYERDARGGTRYCEILQSHFGVVDPSAAVLQRPQFLGGRSVPIGVNQVPQTSVTASTPQGNLAAWAAAVNVGDGFTRSFTEHGIILGLCSVRCDITYQQGLAREFSRSSRVDFYDPAFAHLGEQSILNKEIYLQGSASPTNDAATFGYQERFAEYRYKPSMITGKLRSTYATPLDMWHLSEKFTSLPTLSSTFIAQPTGSSDPIQRIVAVTTEPQFVLDAYVSNIATRIMPTFSVPGYIDHF